MEVAVMFCSLVFVVMNDGRKVHSRDKGMNHSCSYLVSNNNPYNPFLHSLTDTKEFCPDSFRFTSPDWHGNPKKALPKRSWFLHGTLAGSILLYVGE